MQNNEKLLYRRCSKSLLAEIFGIDRRTVDRYLTDHNVQPAGTERGAAVYDIKYAAPALVTAYQPQQSPVLANIDPKALPPKERKDWYESEKTRQIVEEKDGLLVRKEVYRNELASVLKVVANGLDLLPDILEMNCSIDAEMIAVIQSEIDRFRNTLADKVVEASSNE